MPSAVVVKPKKWSCITVLFDNGEYSVISGVYNKHVHLGERWNGGKGKKGFPKVGRNPVWHIVPQFLQVPILRGLLDELASNPNSQPNGRRAAISDVLSALTPKW